MKSILAFAVLAAGFIPAIAHADADAVVGRWYTEGNQSKVEITKKDGKYEGQIVWLKEPNYEEGDPEAGKPVHDRNNPEEAKQDEPILGLKMMYGFTYDADDSKYVDGKIYDPEKGKTYSCQMTLKGENLEVRGYIGSPVFGRSTTWTKVTPEDEKRDKDVGASLKE